MQPHTSCADMMTFAVLAIGCIMVWGYLLRSYLSCSRALKKVHVWDPWGPCKMLNFGLTISRAKGSATCCCSQSEMLKRD